MVSNSAVPLPGSPAAWANDNEQKRGRVLDNNMGRMARNASPVRGGSPARKTGLLPPRSGSPVRNPFNFESKFVSASPVKPSQRRGHRYKHSSVSLNFFQEPEARAPLPIPVSLAVPTLKECYQSVTRAQMVRFGWSLMRFLSALLLYSSDHGTLQSAEALAHLVAYDAVVDALVVGVGVWSNFEVWKRSSLRLPFALQRVEILVSFSLAICLVFVGGHMASHTVQEIAYLFYDEGPHHGHHHHASEASSFSSVLASVAVSLFVTIVSLVAAEGLSIGSMWEDHSFSCITALFAVAVLVVGTLNNWLVDFLLMPTIAVTMVYFGWQTSKHLGGMLVMSYGGPDRAELISSAIAADERIANVSEVSLWQVHHDLWLASIKLSLTGRASSSASQPAVRDFVTGIVDNAMSDLKGPRIEITVDIN